MRINSAIRSVQAEEKRKRLAEQARIAREKKALKERLFREKQEAAARARAARIHQDIARTVTRGVEDAVSWVDDNIVQAAGDFFSNLFGRRLNA